MLRKFISLNFCKRPFANLVKFNKQAFDNEADRYPASSLFGPTWSLGFLLLFYLFVQIITGTILAMYYIPDPEKAFESVHRTIYKNVPGGWFIWYWHINGASFLFALLYMHGLRAVYYGSYLRKAVWSTGVVLFIIMMGAAFTGYVLPWGNMSYWAVTVITSFLSVIPKIGADLCRWVWGSGTVSSATLNRFMILHYLLPMLIVGGSVAHVVYLHMDSSTLPNPTDAHVYDWTTEYIGKDILFLIASLMVMTWVFWYNPDIFSHPESWVKVDQRKTPVHIVPEWYFLPYYAIIKAIESKSIGIIIMFGYIASFILLPFCDPYFYDRTRKLGSREPATKIFLILVLLIFLALFPLGYYPAHSCVMAITKMLLLVHFLAMYTMLIRSFVLFREFERREREKAKEMAKLEKEVLEKEMSAKVEPKK